MSKYNSKYNDKCFCYVLISTTGIFYTGITNNINRRINEHNNGFSGFTSNFDSWELIYKKEHVNRFEARKEEVLIKNTGAKKYLLKLDFGKYSDIINKNIYSKWKK